MDENEMSFSASRYAIPIIDKRPVWLRQNILDELELVNERLEKSFREWELKDAEPYPQEEATGKETKRSAFADRSSMTVKHSLLKEKNTKIEYVQKMILNIPYEPQRDKLLSFLRYYRNQSRFYEEARKDSEELLKEVSDWILNDRARLLNEEGPDVEYTLRQEQNVK
ncbi:uncharacterized protein [Littorina saxatilis]